MLAQIEACFHIFDTCEDGVLTRTEFRAMMEATVALNLNRLLETEEGMASMEVQLQKEYSTENLSFWQARHSKHTAIAL